MKDKTVERIIKIPRVRISDCCRLIFRIGEEPVWRDMDLDPDLYPIYPLPPLLRGSYIFGSNSIKISQEMTINDLSRKICKLLGESWDRSYLHTIIFRTSGEIEIQIESI